MKAKVQYNDFLGTTAADRSDFFVECPHQMESTIIREFKLPLDSEKYDFVGLSVYTTDVNNASVHFYFKDKTNNEISECCVYEIHLQNILNLFKRFEFQVGRNLESINEQDVKLVETED